MQKSKMAEAAMKEGRRKKTEIRRKKKEDRKCYAR